MTYPLDDIDPISYDNNDKRRIIRPILSGLAALGLGLGVSFACLDWADDFVQKDPAQRVEGTSFDNDGAAERLEFVAITSAIVGGVAAASCFGKAFKR